MFHFIISEFKKHNSQWDLFLCMENKENWLHGMGNTPWKIEGIKSQFNQKTCSGF